MSLVLDAFSASIARATQVEKWRDGELLVTPWTFRDGEPVVVYVHEIDRDVYLVTDRGQATDNLMVAGLDFDRAVVARSWDAVQSSLELGLPIDPSHWELRTASHGTELGDAINRVAEAALRADGLRALSSTRAKQPRFNEWVIRAASDRGLTVVPNAELRSNLGIRRKVSVQIKGREDAYVQAIGVTQDSWDAYDRTRSLFTDTNLEIQQRVTVVATGSKLSAEQVRGIALHSRVVEEAAVVPWLDELAA